MQDVGAVFTSEAQERTRKVASSFQVAWKKGLDPSISLFTIGVSSIGGVDVIAGLDQVNSDFNKYQYFDESQYVRNISYERGLSIPQGGIGKAIWDVSIDNTSKRFTPHYMGGDSELFTAVLPRRPVIINTGFNYDGIDHLVPQIVGINVGNPEVSKRNGIVDMQGADMIDFLENRYIDDTEMFTGIYTDDLIETVLQNMGYSTSQYDLDQGINLINFILLEKGEKFIEILRQVVQAEYGFLYQDEQGKVRFENRQHWYKAPHTVTQAVLATADVIEAETIGQDTITNVVEVKSQPRTKQPNQLIYKLPLPIQLTTGSNDLFVDFEDPILEADVPTLVANTLEDGTGTDASSSVSVTNITLFARSAKYEIDNSYGSTVFLTDFDINGRPAKIAYDLYERQQDDSSVTAYEEQPLIIENDYIQEQSWAKSLVRMILNDFSDPENLQKVTIRARPELQLGDKVSWQGRHWRIFDIRTTLDPNVGFVQELELLQRDDTEYFEIGVSSIGGLAQIAP